MKTILAFFFLFFMAHTAWAAAGDRCPSADYAPVTPGQTAQRGCVLLVDNGTGSGESVVEMIAGLPHATSILIGDATGCSAGTVEFFSAEKSGGYFHDIGTDPGTGTNPIITLDGSGVTRINIPVSDYPIGGFVKSVWTGATGCSPGFDILMVHYEEN